MRGAGGGSVSMSLARVAAGNQITLRRSVYALTIFFSFVIGLLAFSNPALASEVLRKVDVLENLNFRSFAFDGRHFVFTRYDTTGNKYELVFYDLKKKKSDFVIPNLSSGTKFLFADDRFAFVIDESAHSQLIIIEKGTPNQQKTLMLGKTIKEVFTIGNCLYVIQSLHGNKDLCQTFDVMTLEPLANKEIEKSKAYHVFTNQIVGIGSRIIVYDHELNPVQQIQNELPCQLGMSGTIKERLFFSDICGKIYEYKTEGNSARVLFDMGTLGLPSTLHSFASLNFDINNDGLLVAVHTNKESYPKLVDVKSGRLLKTLVASNIPDHIMLDDNMLYCIFSDWLGKKSKIEVYAVDSSELYSDEAYLNRLTREHERALGLYRDTKDFYKAVEVLEDADIVSMIKGERQVKNAIKTNILNDYAYFLSLTYDRYKEAIPLLEQVIGLSPERASAYLNIADSYYKLFQYDKSDSQVVEKATAYYEQYMKQMIEQGAGEKALKRAFSLQHEKPVVKNLAMAGWGGDVSSPRDLLFWEDKILAATNSSGPAVEVYDRDDEGVK